MLAKKQGSSVDVCDAAIENGPYLMITRLEIRNFRCFDTLILTGMRRLNLIVGESGSGKTAFMETLFLLSSGSPEGYFRLRKWRGFGEGQLELNGTRDSYEGFFKHLFHSGDRTGVARIRISDTNEGNRSLDIYFDGQETLSMMLPPECVSHKRSGFWTFVRLWLSLRG